MPDPLIVPLVSEKWVKTPAAIAVLPAPPNNWQIGVPDDSPALAKRVQIYARQKGTEEWSHLSDARARYRSSVHDLGVAILPGHGADKETLSDRFRLSYFNDDNRVQPTSLECRVAPVLLASSLDPVVSVFVVKSALSEKFVSELARLLPKCDGKPTLTPMGPVSVAHDLWMQDTTEIGVCAVPDGRGVKQIPVPFGGLRGKHEGIKTEALDDTVRTYFARDPQYVPVQAAESRPNTRWIDWFGNLEVSPPISGFPHGRILTGFQKELRFHPDLMAFLQAQKLQWPPLYLDVSWLTIGHVDELINFVPASGGKGFRALLPSPNAAKMILEKAAKDGHNDALIFVGTKQETTVAKLLREVADTPETRTIEASLLKTRKQLSDELGLAPSDIVSLPVLFKDGLAVIPNGVNSLVIGKDVIVPAPNGPRVGNADLFESAIRERLEPLGLRLHFVDIHEPYHVRSGEIHCGTNAARRLKNPRWWAPPPRSRLS